MKLLGKVSTLSERNFNGLMFKSEEGEKENENMA